tara:strand:- start:3767 stop:4078 length:312 start_codon:yes stop_codon:yes gene_type:complete
MADFLDKELEKINEGLAQTEAAKKEADSLMIKKITKYEAEINKLNEANKRLVEENSNFQIISKSHKELNGDLQKKLSAAEFRIKELEVKLKEQLNQFRNKGEL